MRTFITDILSDLMWDWPLCYSSQEKPTDPRISWFSRQDFDKQSEVIEELTGLLERLKEIRDTKLTDEITKTEEKLKKLKGL